MSIQLAFWAQTVKGTRSCEREGLVGSPPGDQPGEQVFECLHGQWIGFVSGGESVARPGIGWRRHDQSVVPLLVAAAAAAVAALLVQHYSQAWWLLVVAAVGAGLGAAVPWLKERLSGVDARIDLMGRCLRALDDRGRLRMVDELSLTDFGVHPAHVEVEYLPRAREADVVAAMAEGRPVRVVGSSMAGKTRMAVQVARDHYSDWPVVVPVPPRGLLDLVEGGGVPRGAVVWLDDLDRYLAGGGLPVEVLDRVVRSGCRVVATMRAPANQQYQSDGGRACPRRSCWSGSRLCVCPMTRRSGSSSVPDWSRGFVTVFCGMGWGSTWGRDMSRCTATRKG